MFSGYYGNLRESVIRLLIQFPEMLTFIVITLVTSGLLVGSLVLGFKFPLEMILILINLIIALLEVVFK